ncbi:MAG: hypothetical protein EAY76_03610 [Alphaproteobacteria bacterium]|nr:MAG: hypothetical protein EAY76_03610 [Alphaproteobacteria bacterium]TAF41654.1 MAG: hypothetical protein EAZ66_00980 [Alphaproteobacteria bacterium]TAF76500.1 MAG: hypothetical protein EAZ52_03940 [Alphaproteobacteria bacterium]
MVATPEQDEALKKFVALMGKVIDAIKNSDRDELKILLDKPYHDLVKQLPEKSKAAAGVFVSKINKEFEDSRVQFWGAKKGVFDKLALHVGDLSPPDLTKSILSGSGYSSVNQTPLDDKVSSALHQLKNVIHVKAHNAIKELQQSFNNGQANDFNELGAFGYEADIIGKRWSGQADPQTTVHELLHQGRGLQDFGKIVHLDTALKKTGAILASVSCVGVMLHGVHNVHRAFNPEQDKQLEVEEIGHHAPQEGVNFLRLAVGVGELGVGAALLYRMVTGRHINQCGQKLFADDEMIKNMIGGCGHDHSHGHGK